MRNRFPALTALFLALLLCTIAAHAVPPKLTILCEDDRPAQYPGADGKPAGLVVEIVAAIQEHLGTHYPVRLGNWEQIYRQALTSPNTVLFSVARTPAREELFHWVGPVVEGVTYLFGWQGETSPLATLDEAKSLPRIGVYSGDWRERFLLDRGFTNLDSAPSAESNLRKFVAHRVTAIAASDLVFAEKIRQLGGNPDQTVILCELVRQPVYIALSRGTDPATVSTWIAAFEAIRTDGTLAAIYEHYLPGRPLPPPPTAPTR